MSTSDSDSSEAHCLEALSSKVHCLEALFSELHSLEALSSEAHSLEALSSEAAILCCETLLGCETNVDTYNSIKYSLA